MKFENIVPELDGIPYTGIDTGRYFYDFFMAHRPQKALELGFGHGVSTCYFAAALDEYGGTIDAVDRERTLRWDPNLETLIERLGLEAVITPNRVTSSYTWFLKKKIEEQTRDGVCHPVYDFCYIDGPKDWTNDGLAFFLVDKLLLPDGWIIFDDWNWTYRKRNKSVGYVFPSCRRKNSRPRKSKRSSGC